MKRTIAKARPLQIPSRKEWEDMLQISDLPLQLGRIAGSLTLDTQLNKAIESMTATAAREGAVRVREVETRLGKLAAEIVSVRRVLNSLARRLQRQFKQTSKSKKSRVERMSSTTTQFLATEDAAERRERDEDRYLRRRIAAAVAQKRLR